MRFVKDKTLLNYRIGFVLLGLMLVGCQSLAGEDVSVTLSSEMTAFVTESAMIQETAVIEQTDAVETLQASSTLVADAANVNMALVATVESNVSPTVAMRAVVVDAEDMGSSLDESMMDESGVDVASSDAVAGIQVNNIGTARSVSNVDGCSSGNVTQFTDSDDRIYVTARVSDLVSGVAFTVDWMFEERLVYRSSWTSDYSAQSECIWFYMTPDDAAFLPGAYTVTMFVDGQALPSQTFSISTG